MIEIKMDNSNQLKCKLYIQALPPLHSTTRAKTRCSTVQESSLDSTVFVGKEDFFFPFFIEKTLEKFQTQVKISQLKAK